MPIFVFGIRAAAPVWPRPELPTEITPERTALVVTESQLQALLKQGFQVAVLRDVSGAARLLEDDDNQPALIRFPFIANGVLSTAEAVQAMTRAAQSEPAGERSQP